MLSLALLLSIPVAPAAVDCGALTTLYARAVARGGDLPEGTVEMLEGCGESSAQSAVSSPVRSPAKLSTTAASGRSEQCAQVRRNYAELLAMGSEDTQFLHLLADCQGVDGADAFGGAGSSLRYEMSRVVSGYGWRVDPINRSRSFHHGVDLDAKTGDPVPALAAGVVVRAGWWGGYGKMIEVEHPITGLRTRYAHCSALLVRKGDVVRGGQTLGLAGSTGRSTGPHVHLEVRTSSGKSMDPSAYVEEANRLVRF